MYNSTIEEVTKNAAIACNRDGFSFLSIYQVRDENKVADGWDRFIYSYSHADSKDYFFVGYVRADGTFNKPTHI